MRQFRPITVPAQVPQVNSAQMVRRISPATSAAASFDKCPCRLRMRCLVDQRALGVLLQQLHVVVGLQHQQVRRSNPLDDQLGRVSRCVEKPNVAGRCSKENPPGRRRHAGPRMFPPSRRPPRTTRRSETPPPSTGTSTPPPRPGARRSVAVNGHVQPRRQHRQPLDVIDVLVGHENAGQGLPDSGQSRPTVPGSAWR